MRRDALLELLPELQKCLDRKAGRAVRRRAADARRRARAGVAPRALLLVDEMSLGLAPVIVERLLPILRRVAEELARGGPVRRAARLARARGRRPRLRPEPRTARARRRGEGPARPARPAAFQLSRRSRRPGDRLTVKRMRRDMKVTKNWMGILAAIAACALLVSACGGDDNSSSNASKDSSSAATATPDASAALGTANKATGSPITVGLLNLESGPVTFPEYRQAAEAAVKYINDYKGGIGGHPVKLESCATDGQPATSGRCAGQIADKKPTLVLGGADTGAPGAFPVWARADLAVHRRHPVHAGGEQRAERRAVHLGLGRRQRGRRRPTRSRTSGVKKASVIYTDDTQGKFTGLGVIAPVLKTAGRRGQDRARSRRAPRTCRRSPRRRSRTGPTWSTSTRRTPARVCSRRSRRSATPRRSSASTRARRRRRSRPPVTPPRASTSRSRSIRSTAAPTTRT